MTPDRIALIDKLIVGVDGKPGIGKAEFLAAYGAEDGVGLGRELVTSAVDSKNSELLSSALVVVFAFGMDAALIDTLIEISTADWHASHEDIVWLLRESRAARVVPSLVALTEWVPEYLSYADPDVLAIKAIYALGAVPGAAAQLALENLLTQPQSEQRKRVIAEQLGRHRGAL